jgi:hypothetical protein
MPLAIAQTRPRPKIFTAPRGLLRLLEGRFSSRALQTGSFYAARAF